MLKNTKRVMRKVRLWQDRAFWDAVNYDINGIYRDNAKTLLAAVATLVENELERLGRKAGEK